MKKMYVLIGGLVLSLGIQAHIINVEVKNFEYVPANVTVNPGDTIRFTLTEGTHPTASDEALWSTFTLVASMPTKDIICTFPVGTHGYHCTMHGGIGTGMHGTITVTSTPLDIEHIDAQNQFSLNSMLITNSVSITMAETAKYDRISVFNTAGVEVSYYTLEAGEKNINLNLEQLEKGMYFICVSGNGKITAAKKIIKI